MSQTCTLVCPIHFAFSSVFFFQAEDGIRDKLVTGVQTCALPISTDMGSEFCVRELQRKGTKIRGLLNLEMLGYYNDKPKSQLFPPFLSLLYPDRGSFLGLVGN